VINQGNIYIQTASVSGVFENIIHVRPVTYNFLHSNSVNEVTSLWENINIISDQAVHNGDSSGHEMQNCWNYQLTISLVLTHTAMDIRYYCYVIPALLPVNKL
jgi:hypothetical protein